MLDEMKKFGKELKEFRVQQKVMTESLHELIINAYKQGHNIAVIARSLGVTRQTVYTVLENNSIVE